MQDVLDGSDSGLASCLIQAPTWVAPLASRIDSRGSILYLALIALAYNDDPDQGLTVVCRQPFHDFGKLRFDDAAFSLIKFCDVNEVRPGRVVHMLPIDGETQRHGSNA